MVNHREAAKENPPKCMLRESLGSLIKMAAERNMELENMSVADIRELLSNLQKIIININAQAGLKGIVSPDKIC
jgi:hypothetical protein